MAVWLRDLPDGDSGLAVSGQRAAHGLSGVVFALVGYLTVIGFSGAAPLVLALSVFSLISLAALCRGLLPFLPHRRV